MTGFQLAQQLPPISPRGGQVPPPAAAPSGPAATPAPTPVPVDTTWTCTASSMNERGEPAGPLSESLTVGDKFHLACEGAAVKLKTDALSLELPKDQKYLLRLLGTRQISETRGEFIATSWIAGEGKVSNAVLTDGTLRVGLSGIELKVNTVIDPQKNPEMKPAPPWGPASLSWPLWVWASIAIALLVIVLGAAFQTRGYFRRKRLLKLLEKNPIALTPYNQFNKDLRKLSREIPVSGEWSQEAEKAFFKELDETLRWFLARELVIPVFDRKPNDIVKTLKKSHRGIYEVLRRDFTIALTESEKALKSSKRISTEDAAQLLELCRTLVTRVHQMKGA